MSYLHFPSMNVSISIQEELPVVSGDTVKSKLIKVPNNGLGVNARYKKKLKYNLSW